MVIPRLRDRLARVLEPAPSEPRRARLFVTTECGLCTEALALLRPLEHRGLLGLELVDISTDRDLFRRYGLEIPVLEVEGGPTLRWPFDQRLVRRSLR